jgi:hypothetical protein
MRAYKFENREIRSFRIREKALNFNNLFTKKNKFACFLMADLIQPSDRAQLKDAFEEQELKLTFLSKKMVDLLLKDKASITLKNLLKGNVIQIEPYETSKVDDASLQNKIRFVLSQNVFNLRFIVLNDGFYRKEKVEKFLERLNEGENFNVVSITEQLRQPLLKSPLFEGLFFSRQHYSK